MAQPPRAEAGWGEWGPWLFVGGAAAYLALPFEPPPWAWAAAVVLACALALAARRLPGCAGPALACALVLAGGGWTAWTAHRAPPPLAESLPFAQVSGRVESLETRLNGTRVTLSDARIAGREGAMSVRVVFPADDGEPRPGARIAFAARLSPPLPPVHPDAFDLPRRAWFQGLSAMGSAVSPWRELAPPPDDVGTAAFRAAVERARQALRGRVLAAFPPGDARGGIAVALMVGETGAVPPDTLRAWRESGIAHMLSISGLHMSLFAGFAFLVVRRGLALVPALALRHPIKKWAAAVALVLTTLYLLMSGGSLPTQRAWMMTGAALAATMLDRSPFSLRLVGLAAAAVTLLDPEAVLGPSFQMSFGAVLALIAAYRSPLLSLPFRGLPAGLRGAAIALAGTFATTLVATVATAPFALYHFGQVAVHALPANLLGVPVLGLWVMPWGMAAGFAAPFGGEAIPLHAMALGLAWIDRVAATVAAWPGHLWLGVMPDAGVALCAVGGLALCLGQGRARLLGVALVALGFATPLTVTPPDLLVSPGGAVLAVRRDEGYGTIGGRGAFARAVWRARTGLPVEPGGWRCDAEGCAAPGGAVARATPASLADDCAEARVVIARFPVPPPARAACAAPLLLDAGDLAREGALAIWLEPTRIRADSTRAHSGRRPWGRSGADDGDDDP